MDLGPLMVTAAQAYGLDPALVRAQVLEESGGDPTAWNPEPKYRYFWDVSRRTPFRPVTAAEIASEAAPTDFPALAGDPDQEWWAQQASWGLQQVMGAVARERGLRAPYLTILCDPVINLHLGCGLLKDLLLWAHGDVSQALAAFNGGKGGNGAPPFRNAAYAARVLGRRTALLLV